ncbi:hypothetical protein SBA4_2010018 [Candidatus Sulfopaludibacter sp. SbA4]|nr:hypothetical protein SBA4_2010018 [Candidatus Sulfopaludibacter sp. SbA4]
MPSAPITVPRLAPVIVPGSVKITSITSSGFQVILDASSTPRDLTGATFTFAAAPNATLNGTSQTVSLTTAASGWFVPANENPSGGTFSLTVPFPFTGNTSALGTVSVTLTNSAGTSVAQSGGQ